MDNSIPPATLDTQQQLAQRKQALEHAFKEFHKLATNKVLDKNKSIAIKNSEAKIVGDLVQAAVSLEQINIGEGILSLASIAIREQLIIRDRINELEFKLLTTIRDLNQLTEKINNGTKK